MATNMKHITCAMLLLSTVMYARTWTLTWHDEFDGPQLDATKWSYVTGGNGWGNNELETYTDRRENAYLDQGMLVIKVLRERFTGTDHLERQFTSARLQTREKFAQAYGKFEARIKIPSGNGIWPAFWMLGDDFDVSGWPACGEIDIAENIGREPSTVHGTVHFPGFSADHGLTGDYTLPNGQRLADDFHVFGVEWEPDLIRWYIDSRLYFTVSRANLPPRVRWIFDHPFYLLLNVAVGGNWPGNPGQTSSFPQTMLVDYVRVYQAKD
jgi:beta-glucanase (GH16 family)